MNKFITVAALLAAGTAFSNAAAISSDLADSLTWTDITLTAPANGSLTTGNSGLLWDNAATLSESWQISFDWASTSDKTTIELFGTNTVKQTADGLVIAYNVSAQTLTVGPKTGDAFATINGVTLPTATAPATVTLTYLKSNSDAYSDTVYLQLSSIEGTVAGEVTGTLNTAITPYTTGANYEEGTSRLWTNGGADVLTNITLKSASAIPEPSAFGLLAGVGALALVAARRRRTK